MPRLASSSRLSKPLIIRESLKHIQQQHDICIAVGRELQELLAAHNALIAEVNLLRRQLHECPEQYAPRHPSTAFLSVMNIENQPCRDFSGGSISPDATDSHGSQPSARHSEMNTPLAEAHTAPPVWPQTTAQSLLPSYQDGLYDFNLLQQWQMQTSGHNLQCPEIQDAFAPEIEYLVPAAGTLESEAPWEDVSNAMLPFENESDCMLANDMCYWTM